jgi:hypothetical protein
MCFHGLAYFVPIKLNKFVLANLLKSQKTFIFVHCEKLSFESTPKTLKKENHGGTEDTEAHRELLIRTISFVKLRDLVP